MDQDTKHKVKNATVYTPRYLFRMWNRNTDVDGGLLRHVPGCNDGTAIRPLFFRFHTDHQLRSRSAYEMTREEFTTMVKAHTAGSFDIVTRFSSWTASLAFVLKFWRGKGNKYHSRFHPDNISDLVLKDSLYISALDTALLPDDQEVFWVPSLDFLAPGQLVDHDEYLVHGVVHGPGYKTLPLRVFLNAHRDCVRAAWEHSCAACDGSLLVNTPARTTTVTPITTQCIARARAVGEAYGGTFALPMTLATIALHQRELNYFDDGVPEEVMQLVLRGVDGLEVPAGWSDEPTIVSNVLSENNREAAEFCSLMRAVLNRRGSGGSGWTSVD